MKRVIFFAVILALLPIPGMSAITFRVTDHNNTPVEGALITVDGTFSASTGTDGFATIAVEKGNHEYTVVKEGYFHILKKLTAAETQVNTTLFKYVPWSSFVANNFESRDPAINRIKFYPAEFSVKRTDPDWYFNCLGEHDGTVRPYGSDNHASFTAGNYLTYQFEGTSIRVFTLRSRNSGMAKITVDGAHEKIVDLYADNDTNGDYELAYEKYGLAPAKHTVKLEVLGKKRAIATEARIYFDFCDISDYPVFPRFGLLPYGVTGNTAKGVTFNHCLKATGTDGFKSVEEVGFVVVDRAKGRAPTINDIRMKAKLNGKNEFSATSADFAQRVKYVVLSYAVVAGVVYYSEEPVFFTPVSRIVLERNVLGIQAGQGKISTRSVILRDAGGIPDLKWKVQSRCKYDGTPATDIISGSFADGAAAEKDVPIWITGLREGEAVIRCYSASDPEHTYADCLVTVAKAERNTGVAERPLMGWSNWNHYGRAITKESMSKSLDNMLKPLPAAGGKSLKDLGYTIFQVDGGWRMNWLAPDGRIVPNARFGGREGFKELSDYIHENGMKLGIHMCPGWGDCAGQPMGIDGFEKIHMQEYVYWKTDFLFVDGCTLEQGRRNNPDSEYKQTLYTKFKYYLDNCGRDIHFMANYGPVEWGYPLVNSWRVSGDIATLINTHAEGGGRWLEPLDRPKPKNSAAFIGAKNGGNQWERVGQGTGLWAHADAMALGDPGLNLIEQQSMFNMWSITSVHLILGGDLNKITDEKEGIVQIITNEEVIAVNQDPLGRAGHVLKAYTNNPTFTNQNPDAATAETRPEVNLTVYGRPLYDGSWALVIMNNTKQMQNVTVSFADLDYDGSTKLTAGKYYLRNLNTREEMGLFTDKFTINDLPVHGSVMIKVTPEQSLKNK